MHQGETNTGDAQWPLYVQNIYNDMLTDLSLNPDSVPLLAGELLATEENKFDISNSDDSPSPIQQKITIPSLKIEKLNAK